ncbi:MAG: PhnD/SsuA/transferrin family substrate-binding protein [Myxococcota bacterium]|nr:PhnD/SsuA/transferrin family substrate-binding protein [Myxococcota bacterium]
MRFFALYCITLISVVALPGKVSANSKLTFLICQPGGPDLKDQEQALMRDFYSYVGKRVGVTQDNISGEYLTKRKKCLKALKKKPSVLMLSLDMFLSASRAKSLKPVAQIKMRGKTSGQYFLMSSVEGPKELSAIRGKQISGTMVQDSAFVAKVVMNGQLGAADSLKLKPQKLGLRGVRDVIRGKSAAVLLDEAQYNAIEGTPFQKKLQLVFTSDPLPNAPIAVSTSKVKGSTLKKMQNTMRNMTQDPEGKKLLDAFGIDAFVAPKKDVWNPMMEKMSR